MYSSYKYILQAFYWEKPYFVQNIRHILPQIDYCSILFYSVFKKGIATIERIQK